MDLQKIIDWTGRDYNSDFSDFFNWIKRILVDMNYAIDYGFYDEFLDKSYYVECYIGRRGTNLYARGTGKNKEDAFCNALIELINKTNKRWKLKH